MLPENVFSYRFIKLNRCDETRKGLSLFTWHSQYPVQNIFEIEIEDSKTWKPLQSQISVIMVFDLWECEAFKRVNIEADQFPVYF